MHVRFLFDGRDADVLSVGVYVATQDLVLQRHGFLADNALRSRGEGC